MTMPSVTGMSAIEETAQIPLRQGSMRALLVKPATSSPAPGVLLFHEIFGLNDDMADKARRFSAMGYVALVPDLFAGRGRKPICLMRTMRELGRGSGAAFDRIEAARSWLAQQPFLDASRLGVCGFCMGGGFALPAAARAPIGAVAVFYGQVPKKADELDGICPVVAVYGGRDRSLRGAPERLRAALEQRAVPHDITVYRDAGHGYLSSHTAAFAKFGAVGPIKLGFNGSAAEDSWKRVERFFRRHLAGEEPVD